MDETKNYANNSSPPGIGWQLFGLLSRSNTQAISAILLVLLSLQVLFGVFIRTTDTLELAAYYFGRTVIIRLVGYCGLVNGLVAFYCSAFVHRGKTWKWTYLKRPWNGFFVLLLLWALLAIGAAKDRELSVFGNPYRYEGYLSYLAYGGIFVSAIQIRAEKYRKLIFTITAIVSTLLAGLTLLKDLAGVRFLMYRGGMVGEFSGTFINSNHYGYYLCVSLIVIAGLFLITEKLRWKIACGVCYSINLITLMFNGSLGPYLALALGLILLFVFSWIRKGFKKTWPLIILVVLFILFSFIFNGQRMVNDLNLIVQQSLKVIGIIGSGSVDNPESQQAIDRIGSGRGVIWKNTIKTILDNPVIGVGTDNIQLYIDNEIPHNEYLQVAANLGIPGLLIYLAGLVSCFLYALKNLKKLGDGTVIAFVATLVYCASAFVGISIPVATYQLFLFLGLLCGWFKDRDDTRMNEEAMEEMRKALEEKEKQTEPESEQPAAD